MSTIPVDRNSFPESKSNTDIFARKIKVMAVDDHPVIREALSFAVRNKLDMEFCGEAASVEEALSMLPSVEPDVAIVDLSLRDAHGLDLVQTIRSDYPDTQVLIYSMYDELAFAERAIHMGALGYLSKNEPTEHIIEAIRSVVKGEVYLSRRMTSRILGKVVKEQQNGFVMGKLTTREMAIFKRLGEGQSVSEIAQELTLSKKTVETYRRRVKEKLGLKSVSDLVQYAIQWMHGEHISG